MKKMTNMAINYENNGGEEGNNKVGDAEDDKEEKDNKGG